MFSLSLNSHALLFVLLVLAAIAGCSLNPEADSQCQLMYDQGWEAQLDDQGAAIGCRTCSTDCLRTAGPDSGEYKCW